MRRLLLGFAAWLLLADDSLIRFSDDGGWCWFQDPRAIVTGGKLLIGTVAAGRLDPRRRGDLDVVAHDLATGVTRRHTLLHTTDPALKAPWMDDHNSPVFWVRPDGRILTAFSQHHLEGKVYYRISRKPNDPSAWDELRVFTPSATSLVTYTNLISLRAEGRLYDFFRGLHGRFKPSYAYSDDAGAIWRAGNVVVDMPAKIPQRPYAKYASDGNDTIHIAYTEGHPREFVTSLYHVYYRGGKLHRSDGSVIRSLAEGLKSPGEGTRVFAGDAGNLAWISDLRIDGTGRPYLAFSVRKGSGEDHRYHFAEWNGSRWLDTEVAYAGSKLYAGEEDYTGLPCLDPHDPAAMYISTNADPMTGKPLISAADRRRHWEIFAGARDRSGRWTWRAVTRNSTADNLRPMMPVWPGDRRALLWLRGTMKSYLDYSFEVVGRIEARGAGAAGSDSGLGPNSR